MIDSLQNEEVSSHSDKSFEEGQLLHILKAETEDFSRMIEFFGLDYEARREKVQDMISILIDLFKEQFDGWNGFMTLLKEIIKNSADHSNSTLHISLNIGRDAVNKRIYIKFVICDNGPGLPFSENQLDEVFSTSGSQTKREKKGKYNFGIGLGIIKGATEVYNIDLILHNKGKIHHINDLGLQTSVTPRDDFGYEGIGIFITD